MAKGLRCAWAVFSFSFSFYLILSFLFPSWLFSRFPWEVGLFFFLFEGCQHWIFLLDCFLFQFFFLFLTHEAAFHYRSSGSFFHCLFFYISISFPAFPIPCVPFFYLFFPSLFLNQEAFPATKLYKDWLVLLLFSLSRFISIFGVDGRVFPFSLSWNFYSSFSIYTFTKRVGVCRCNSTVQS